MRWREQSRREVRIGGVWMLTIFPPTRVSLDEGGEQVLTNHRHRRDVHSKFPHTLLGKPGLVVRSCYSCILLVTRFESTPIIFVNYKIVLM